MEKLAALAPPILMAVFFITLVVTALRATDWADKGRRSNASRKDEVRGNEAQTDDPAPRPGE